MIIQHIRRFYQCYGTSEEVLEFFDEQLDKTKFKQQFIKMFEEHCLHIHITEESEKGNFPRTALLKDLEGR